MELKLYILTVINTQPEQDSALDLDIGQVGTVKGFNRRSIASKLLAMGVLPGSRIELLRQAPFGGTYYVAVNSHFLALRRKELQSIHVEK